MPSSSRAAGTATQTQTRVSFQLKLLCFKVSPPHSQQRASHPQKSLPDMLFTHFQAINTPSSHLRAETGSLFLLLFIFPLFSLQVPCTGAYQYHCRYFPSCLRHDVCKVVTQVIKFRLSFQLGLTRLSEVLQCEGFRQKTQMMSSLERAGSFLLVTDLLTCKAKQDTE